MILRPVVERRILSFFTWSVFITLFLAFIPIVRKGLDNTHTLTCDGAWDPESGRRTAQHAILESLLSTVECLLRLPPVVKHVEIEHEA